MMCPDGFRLPSMQAFSDACDVDGLGLLCCPTPFQGFHRLLVFDYLVFIFACLA